MKLKNLFLFIIWLSAGIVFAQAPMKFNYQAVGRDAGGNVLANQNVGMEISIRQTTVSGPVVYTETHATITSSIGLMNLQIGGGTVTAGNFSTIDWSAGPYFIEIGMDATGGTTYVTMGTQQLLSVPYALYAENSGTPGPQGIQGVQGIPGVAGTNGTNGISILWLGTLTSAPASPVLNNAYYNSTDGISYVWDGTTWNILAKDGAIGSQGIQGIQGLQGIQGIQGVQGIPGTNGTNGINGVSLVWLGTMSSAPGSPALNNAYYNSTDGIAYVWDGSIWNIVSKDGTNGAQGIQGIQGNQGIQGTTGLSGISIAWLGALGSAPGSPTLNNAYYNSTDGISYIWDGSMWNTLAKDGANGSQGIQGIQGVQGVAGTNGANGSNGSNGTNGASFLSGSGTPSGGTGVNGDTYINLATGNTYLKTGGVWNATGNNLMGPQGIQGIQGVAGTNGTNGSNGTNGLSFLQGTGVPAAGLGIDGDTYLDIATGNTYKKTSGSWNFTTNVWGPTLYSGSITAATSPPAGTGVVGDYYLSTLSGNFYKKTGVSTWTLQGDLINDFKSGYNTGSMSTVAGNIGDSYINFANGRFYKNFGTTGQWNYLGTFGGVITDIREVATSYSIQTTDGVVFTRTTGNEFTLPLAILAEKGKIIYVRGDVNNQFTVTTSGSDKIIRDTDGLEVSTTQIRIFAMYVSNGLDRWLEMGAKYF